MQRFFKKSKPKIHTRLRNADSDRSALESSTRKVQGLLQTVDGVEFDVTKSLRALCQFILHNTDVGHIATREEFLNIGGGRIEGKVADVRGVRRLGRKRKRLSNRERAVYSKFYQSANAVSWGRLGKSHTRIAVETRSRRRRSRASAHGRNGCINHLDRNFQQKIRGGDRSGSNIQAADYHCQQLSSHFNTSLWM